MKKLVIVFDSQYPASVVEQDLQSVVEIAGRVFNTGMGVEIRVEKTDDEASEETDEQVELVKKVFRGEIIQE